MIRRVLSAAGALPAEVGLHVLEEYRLAMALRGGHRGQMHTRARGQTPRQRLSAQRIVSAQDFEHGNDRWRLERLLFADDVIQLKLSGTDTAGARRSMGQHMAFGPPGRRRPNQPSPQTIALQDDRGSKATARLTSSGWGGGTWEASYTTDTTLSADTRWIELDGSRLDLPERRPTPDINLEPIEQLEPLRAALCGDPEHRSPPWRRRHRRDRQPSADRHRVLRRGRRHAGRARTNC